MTSLFGRVSKSSVLGIITLLLVGAAGAHAQEFGPGVPNVPQEKGRLLAGPFATQDGRVAVLAYHQGYIVSQIESPGSASGSNQNTRYWDLSNLQQPRSTVIPEIRPNASMAAHGFWKEGNCIRGLPGGDLWFTGPGQYRVGNCDAGSWYYMRGGGFRWPGRGLGFQPWVMSMWWSYGDTNYNGALYLRDQQLAAWDQVGTSGVIGHPVLLGNYLYYLSDGSHTGIAVYDITPSLENPGTPPALVGLFRNNVGGYWPELWGGNGKLRAFFPDRGRGKYSVVDVTDPTNMQLVANYEHPGAREWWQNPDPMYVQFQDNFAFSSIFKVDMENPQTPDPFIGGPAVGIDVSQYSLPVGNLVITGGLESGGAVQGMAVWAHQNEPDRRGPSVGYHVPEVNRLNYHPRAPISLLIHETIRMHTLRNGSTFLVQRVGNNGNLESAISGRIAWGHNDVLTFTPDVPLSENSTYQVTIPEGGILDAVGNGIQRYSWRFSTGSVLITSGSSPGSNPPPTPTTPPTASPTPEPEPTQLPTPNPTAEPTPTPFPTATPAPSPLPEPPTRNSAPLIQGSSVSPALPRVSDEIVVGVQASDPDGDVLSYQFVVEGEARPFQPSSEARLSFNQPGNYEVLVTVRDTRGATALKRLVVSVAAQELRMSRHSSSVVEVFGSPGLAAVVFPDNNLLRIFRGAQVVHEEKLPTRCNPRSLGSLGNDRFVVPCYEDDSLLVVEAGGGVRGTLRFRYGSAPFGIVVDSERATAFVSLFGSGEVAKVDLRSDTPVLVSQTRVGPTPRALALSSDNSSLFVTRLISAEEFGEVWKINTSDLTTTTTFRLYPDTVSEDSGEKARGLPNYLSAIALNPQGTRALVTAKKDNIFRGESTDGNPLGHDNTVRALVLELDLRADQELLSNRRDIDNADSPSAVEYDPRGQYAVVTLQGNNNFALFDMVGGGVKRAPSLAPVQRISTQLAPQGVAFSTDGSSLWIHNFMSRSITHVDTKEFLAGTTGALPSKSSEGLTSDVLSPEVLRGKQVFYNASERADGFGNGAMSAEGYISCASCHLDGGHDGRNWDFTDRGEGIRNTTSLLGQRGDEGGMLHWTGNFDEVQDFEHDIRNSFGGFGFIDNTQFFSGGVDTPLGSPKAGLSEELDALATYLRSLRTFERSPLRTENGKFTIDAIQGSKLFAALNCTSCHSGVLFSDSPSGIRHNVGTALPSSGGRLGVALDGFDTPTLIGLHHSAPYLHDGSVASLEELFSSPRAGEIHNLSSRLSTQHRALLVSFLYQLDLPASEVQEEITTEGQRVPILDLDADALADDWEIRFFGGTIRSGADDADGDGVNDKDEFLQGTDPTNPSSRPALVPTPEPMPPVSIPPRWVLEAEQALINKGRIVADPGASGGAVVAFQRKGTITWSGMRVPEEAFYRASFVYRNTSRRAGQAFLSLGFDSPSLGVALPPTTDAAFTAVTLDVPLVTEIVNLSLEIDRSGIEIDLVEFERMEAKPPTLGETAEQSLETVREGITEAFTAVRAVSQGGSFSSTESSAVLDLLTFLVAFLQEEHATTDLSRLQKTTQRESRRVHKAINALTHSRSKRKVRRWTKTIQRSLRKIMRALPPDVSE